jgi:hypothetical protein
MDGRVEVLPEVQVLEEQDERHDFFCNLCNQTFESKKKLYLHTRYKHGAASNCNVCGKQFATKVKAQQHQVKVHSGRREVCTKCGDDFSCKSSRNRHKKKCRGKGIHRCGFCSKQFCKKTVLRSHMRRRHMAATHRAKTSYARYRGRELLWACHQCGGRFKRSDQLKQHRCRPIHRRAAPRQLTGLRRLQALEVEREQPDMGEMEVEGAGAEVTEQVEGAGAEVGEQVEGAGAEVGEQVEGAGGEAQGVEGSGGEAVEAREEEPAVSAKEPVPSFPCVSCEKRFASMRDLGRHVGAVHPLMLLNCEHCPATFTTRKQLKQHTKRQHNETGFLCPRCKVDIRHKANLPGHERACQGGRRRQAKPYMDCSKVTQWRRVKEVVAGFSDKMSELDLKAKKKVIKNLLKNNPDILDGYTSNPFNEDDVIDLVRDVRSLSDNTLLKILAKMRKKWPDCIGPKIRQALRDTKRRMDHLFKLEHLNADTMLHFTDEDGNPLDRWVVYCHQLDDLLDCKELMLGEEEDNVFGIDDGKKLLKCVWNSVKRGEVGRKGFVGGGARHCQYLFVVSRVKESYHNMKVCHCSSN